jgi:hypothetical protein
MMVDFTVSEIRELIHDRLKDLDLGLKGESELILRQPFGGHIVITVSERFNDHVPKPGEGDDLPNPEIGMVE